MCQKAKGKKLPATTQNLLMKAGLSSFGSQLGGVWQNI